ncbi:hypothetical protein [Maricaulis maris]|uniref:Uncharacterized protein n=1 Tax=Maricaulis maris TaxID=74318 RepID=A0A495DLU0_9PROT|nr:hypothetical protein [Maricaulis maris]RKR03610.1 hypothetical protein C7435_0047 [Maricaulis maris]
MTHHPALAIALITCAALSAGAHAESPTATGPERAPAAALFGQDLETLQPLLDAACDTVTLRELPLEQMPIARTSHIQADCTGLDHAGAPREAEFVFADDALAFVWVLTEAEEAVGLRAALEAAHGMPSHDLPMATAFTQSHLALRHDTPELLYYGAHVAPIYQGWFDQMAAQSDQ